MALKFSAFSFFLIIFLVILSGIIIEDGLVRSAEENRRDLITWDDMKISTEEVLMYSSGERKESGVIVVDQNGKGDSNTVQGAVDMVPENNSQRTKIYIFPGTYREKVSVPENKPYISFIGNQDYPERTIITWDDKASDEDANGFPLGTSRTASVTIQSDYFCATGITFMNTDINRGQAVALRLKGDKAMLYKVRILGAQDTLLDESGSHYFEQCFIQGTTDFIFGNAKSLYKRCVISSSARSSGAIAAHHRDTSDEDTGYSFLNCTINGSGHIYLGRAWGNYSRVIYSYSDIADIITPSGWSDFGHEHRQRTAMFGEYNNYGEGADRDHRVKWSHSLTDEEARPFLDRSFINGEQWLEL